MAMTAMAMGALAAGASSTTVAMSMAALGAASAAAKNQAASAQISAQNRQIDMQNQQVDLNNAATIEQMRDNYAALGTEQAKAAAESLQQGQDVQKAAIQAKSQANLMAAATGMGGASVEDMFYAVSRDKNQSMSNVISNYEDRVYEINLQAENVYNQAKGSLQNKTARLNKPSSFSKVANIAVGAISGYMTGSGVADSVKGAAAAKAGAGAGSGMFESLFKSKTAAPIIKGGV